MRRLDVETVGLQPLVDRVHLLPAVSPEADMKSPRIDDLPRLVKVVQGQNEPRLVNQHDQAALGLRDAPEAKVLFEECPCLWDIRNSEIEMVQRHVCLLCWAKLGLAAEAPLPRRLSSALITRSNPLALASSNSASAASPN